jgi:hypothetical protein
MHAAKHHLVIAHTHKLVKVGEDNALRTTACTAPRQRHYTKRTSILTSILNLKECTSATWRSQHRNVLCGQRLRRGQQSSLVQYLWQRIFMMISHH